MSIDPTIINVISQKILCKANKEKSKEKKRTLKKYSMM